MATLTSPGTSAERPTAEPPRITGVELFPMSSPLKLTIHMREETLTSIDSVLIKIHTDAGIVGIADIGNVSPSYHGETQESIMAMVQQTFFPHILQGEYATNIEKIVAKMEFMCRDNFQAKTLVDCALHDIKAKFYGVPLYEILGGKSADRIQLGWVMSAEPPEQSVKAAQRALDEGFTALKLKMGQGSLKTDLATIRAVREHVGPDIKLWVDVNGAWTYQEALDSIRAVEKFDLWFIEQPLPHWDIDGHARLRGKVGTPIYADESARELSDIQEIIRKDAADGLMIKVPKAGGLLKSQQWISVAQSAGLSVMCGCMAGCGFEAAAYTHLLCANAWASQFIHENLGPLHIHDVFNTVENEITDDIALHVPRYEGGYLYPTEAPGIGMELNPNAIPGMITAGKQSVSAGTVDAG